MKIDVRKSTCQGGGALWSLLSHVRDLPPGDSIEFLTDDSMAEGDIPAWVHKRNRRVSRRLRADYARFVIERPCELVSHAMGLIDRPELVRPERA